MKLQDLTVKQFLEKTASDEPIPGGGSASALNAALASALTHMMAGLTVGRKKYAEVESRMKQVLLETDTLRNQFVDDIDSDADAYQRVMDAYRLPKDTDTQKESRAREIEEAMKKASLVPMAVAERSFGMMETIIDTVREGNRNAVTDGMVALMTCRTAIMGALLNVRINLGGINDAEFADMLRDKCDRIEKMALSRESEMIEWVKSVL